MNCDLCLSELTCETFCQKYYADYETKRRKEVLEYSPAIGRINIYIGLGYYNIISLRSRSAQHIYIYMVMVGYGWLWL
jgi:hypothetical protein